MENLIVIPALLACASCWLWGYVCGKCRGRTEERLDALNRQVESLTIRPAVEQPKVNEHRSMWDEE